MKSNCAAVKSAIRAHIAEHISAADLKAQVEYLIKTNRRDCPTIYHAVRHMVEGGMFLIADADIATFIESLDINPKGKQYDRIDTFRLYCHLIARDAELIVKKA